MPNKNRITMDARRLKRYRAQLHSNIPLLGAWLQGQAMSALAQDGSAESLRLLGETALKSQGSEPGGTALRYLQRLAEEGNVAAREALCRLVMMDEHCGAANIVHKNGYAPKDKTRRALFFFLTQNWGEYENLDFNHQLLREAYDNADSKMRRRVAALARRAGRLEWVDVVIGKRQPRQLARLSADEWRSTLTILEEGQRWEDLWRLAQEAPPLWSATILRSMRRPRGVVRTEDTGSFAELVRLARRWISADLEPYFHLSQHVKAHEHEVRCLAVDPVGKLLASGSADRNVRLWSLPELKPLRTLRGHKGWVNSVLFSRNSEMVAGAGRDGLLCLWRTASGRSLQRLHGHEQSITSFTASPDDKFLVTGSRDATIRIWDFARGESLAVLDRHEGPITAVDISCDGRWLASGSGDCTIRLWTLPEGKPLSLLDEHRDHSSDTILAVAFSRDGSLLATSATDGVIFLWSVPDGKLQKKLRIHTGSASALKFALDGRLLVSAGGEYAVQLWRIPSGRLQRTLEGTIGQNPLLAQSPRGDVFVTAGGDAEDLDRAVRIWTTRSRSAVGVLDGHERMTASVAFSPDGRQLIAGDGNGAIRVWSAETARLAHLPPGQASLGDLAWVQATLKVAGLPQVEMDALAFIEAVQRWRRRSDIMVGEAGARVIEVGEFDIQIEG
jgi:WD40 repeat protein